MTVSPSPVVPHAPVIQLFSWYRSPKVSDLRASRNNLKWYKTLTGGEQLLPSTRLMPAYYYVSQTSASGCESERRRVVVMLLTWPFLPNNPSFVKAVNDGNSISANVYPNPSYNGIVTVSIQSSNRIDKATIQLLDLSGRVLLSESAVNNKGNIQKVLDVSRLPSAVYIIKFIEGKQSGNIKLVLTK